MYVSPNFRTKKALKAAVAMGETVRVVSTGLGHPTNNGTEYVEGPHSPAPHSWYAEVEVKDGKVVKVK